MKNYLKMSLFLLCAAHGVFANAPEVSLSYRFQNAETQINQGGAQTIVLDQQNTTNDPRIDKAIFVAKLGDVIFETLTNLLAHCEEPEFPIGPRPLSRSMILPRPMPPFIAGCDHIKEIAASSLRGKIEYYATLAAANSLTAYDDKIAEALDLLRELATNIQNFTGYTGFPEFVASPRMGSANGLANASFGLATGGAQDYAFFKNVVKNGGVPRPENFDAKGFMSEFDLPMGDGVCDQLLCINPVYKYESEHNKLFVSVAMNTNITETTFVRKPLNLSLVIDISGSMYADDNTEKSRLEWAKDAARKTIAELNHDDYVSLVVFDDAAEVLVPATQLSSNAVRDHILSVIANLQTDGSTNLYDGLKAGYELVSDNAEHLPGYNHRVILISDAGLNTGTTDEAVTVALVSDYAAENIGLTAIGLGLNFNQDFITAIARSLGGNYIYAHSGRDMVRYFSSFKFLVSPVAHHLKARLNFANTSAKLVKAYGIPGESLTSSDELISVQSLFLTNQGGGAILLEYLLE